MRRVSYNMAPNHADIGSEKNECFKNKKTLTYRRHHNSKDAVTANTIWTLRPFQRPYQYCFIYVDLDVICPLERHLVVNINNALKTLINECISGTMLLHGTPWIECAIKNKGKEKKIWDLIHNIEMLEESPQICICPLVLIPKTNWNQTSGTYLRYTVLHIEMAEC